MFSATRPLSPEPVVAVVGATGLVGRMLLQILEERSFPVGELLPLAGERSRGTRIPFRGKELACGEATAEVLGRADLVFLAGTGELSRTLAPEAVRRGARVIDKSSTWRLHADVPLVVPEVNGRELTAETGLVACPNCTTIGVVMALEPLRRAAGLERVVVTTLQAASGAGRAGLRELEGQEAELAAGGRLGAEVFAGVLARNVLPVCDVLEADGATAEERKLLLETRKILALPTLEVAATCTRVPVPIGHAAALLVETVRSLDVAGARAALERFPGVRLVGQPTPRDAAGCDDVLVGRLRPALAGRGLQLWQVADNLRKGAATNAVQIAELLLERTGS